MSTVIVSNAKGLAAALSTVKAGDVIQLAPGNYGDLTINSKNFTTADVTITSLDAKNPAVFHSVNIMKSSGINFDGVNVDFVPDATTVTFSSAVKIYGSTDISFTDGFVKCGNAISGVTQDAAKAENGGNVIGLPTGRGFTIDNSSKVTVENVDISQVHRGITFNKVTDLVIKDNRIHDIRTSPIAGGDGDRVLIQGNFMTNSRPWGWGTAIKDHGDFIHIWTTATQGDASRDIRIIDNVMEQGAGTAIMGIYLDDNGQKIGYTNVEISGNLLINGDHQGIRLEYVHNSAIVDNTLLQSVGGLKAPGMVITAGSSNLTIDHNVAGFIEEMNGAGSNAITDNLLVQSKDPRAANYYSADQLKLVDDAATTDLAHDLAWKFEKAGTTGGSSGTSATLTVDSDVGAKLTAKSGDSYTLIGKLGNDTLVGLGGDDVLKGGGGNDYLAGNGGNDQLFGGAGADKFVFPATHQASGGVDTIADFNAAEGDKIIVNSMDANTTLAGNQAFTFLGQGAFTKKAGELHYRLDGNHTVLEGDTNGDGAADFSIVFVGTKTFLASDFTL